MTNIEIANGIVFQALRISKDSFNDRLLAQKKVFLLQELGVDLGYSFNWYIHGPYSPSLTAYIFNNLDVLKTYDYSRYRLSETAQIKITEINDLSEKKPDSLSSPSWYELLASVLYIAKKWTDNGNVFEILSKFKPQYSKEQFCEAVRCLNEIGVEIEV